MQNPERCEVCGGDLEFRREGSVQGYYCKSCDWAVVTTYIPAIQLDETKYQVRLLGAGQYDEKQIRAVANVSNQNFLQARKLAQQEQPTVFEGVAIEVLKVRETLSAAGLRCAITPPFNY